MTSYSIFAFSTTVIQPSVSVREVLLLIAIVTENNENELLVLNGPMKKVVLYSSLVCAMNACVSLFGPRVNVKFGYNDLGYPGPGSPK